MSTQLVVQQGNFLSQEKIKLIKELYCKKASAVELQHFLEVCESRKLDPVLKQIHAVFRFDKKANKDVMSIQVGIDGFRALAARTGEYAGNDTAKFEWANADDFFPVEATVTVYRLVGGIRCPFTATAYWDEYYPGDNNSQSFFWKKMPNGQLAKCAETLALRKAFPGEMSGVYEPAELDQAGEASPIENESTLHKALAPESNEVRQMGNIQKQGMDNQQPQGLDAQKIGQLPWEKNAVAPTAVAVPNTLADYIVQSGRHAGDPLGSQSKNYWFEYSVGLKQKLPSLPPDDQRDCQLLITKIEAYLAEKE